MTPRFSAGQNKIRLISVFLFTVVLVLTVYVLQGRHHQASLVGNAEMVDESIFMGLKHARPSEIRTALPEATGKITLLKFGSKLCHDCQRLAPVLSQVMAKHPEVYFRSVDVLEDRDKAPAVFRAFKPVTVPMLVFIDARGEIRNVLYNYQSPEAITAALNSVEHPAGKGRSH